MPEKLLKISCKSLSPGLENNGTSECISGSFHPDILIVNRPGVAGAVL